MQAHPFSRVSAINTCADIPDPELSSGRVDHKHWREFSRISVSLSAPRRLDGHNHRAARGGLLCSLPDGFFPFRAVCGIAACGRDFSLVLLSKCVIIGTLWLIMLNNLTSWLNSHPAIVHPSAAFIAFFRTQNLTYPTVVFVFMRAWTLGAAAILLQMLPVQTSNVRFYYDIVRLDSLPLGWLWAPWQRSDANWYTAIATRGYAQTDLSTAFFPLYPLLIRALTSVLPINGVAAGLLISSAGAFGAFVLFYRLVYAEKGRDVARTALLYLAVFPTAFFLFAVYTESLFLFLVLVAWRYARSQQWESAGIFASLGALTRPQGVLIVLPLAAIFWTQWRDRKVQWYRIFNLAVPIIAVGMFLIYLSRVTGSLGTWFAIEGLWRQSALPWDPLIESARVILSGGDGALMFLNILDLALTLLFIGGLFAQLRAQQWADAIYTAIIVLPPLFAIAHFVAGLPLASMSRFLVIIFPAFAWLGASRVAKSLTQGMMIFSLVLQTFLLFLFTHWIFVG
jgi:Gpi18-like mannosyltransferase